MGRPFNMFVAGFLAAVTLAMVLRGDAFLAVLNGLLACANLCFACQPRAPRRDA